MNWIDWTILLVASRAVQQVMALDFIGAWTLLYSALACLPSWVINHSRSWLTDRFSISLSLQFDSPEIDYSLFMAGPVPFRPVSSEVQVAFKALELDRITIHLRCLFGRFESIRPTDRPSVHLLTDWLTDWLVSHSTCSDRSSVRSFIVNNFRHFNWKRH